ncbi:MULTISPECIES: AbrB family transcriptional regulator [unclassified Acinetobacter]|uniref:AbrB family transcriptional regulator n=1 Tax=unclassified Acinetobacter TaxID=196816 RepID=UPI0015D40844|nr:MULTISPECIES: AbrB family transcriptional regulator [unclassified Acinetobacter]UUS64500.1 AbrB family transcriptional regulator [Acinetobacter sp. YH12068_T]
MEIIKLNAKGLVCALIGALIANLLHLPLPWLLGPLLAALLFGCIGQPLTCSPHWRKVGQVIIGMVLGLYFTPALVHAISAYWIFIVLGILWSLILGTLIAGLQYRINGLDWATAWFSSAIGSASEMVNIAEHHHAQVDKVVAAHSLRIVALVVLVPIVLAALFDIHWVSLDPHIIDHFGIVQIFLLFALACLIAQIFQKFNVLNAWVLGPLVMVGFLSFFGALELKFPTWFTAFGQICIGWSLGTKFPFGFLKSHKKFIAITTILNLLALGLSILFALFLMYISHANGKILVLGLSPGGIAEMSLMAKALGLAVPIVVAFQLSRLIFVILTTNYFYQLSKKIFFKTTDKP